MLRQIAKRHMTAGLLSALRNLVLELKIAQIHRDGIRRAKALRHGVDLKLNLGCGPDIKPGYVNIDLGEKADLRLDLRELFPISSNSCSIVQSEHFLEHLSYPEDAMRFLSECFRVLRPGGVFRVG